MKLDEYYTVVRDAHSWNLVYKAEGEINPKTGKPKQLSDISYHPTLKECLKWYVNQSLMDKDPKNLKEVLTALDKIEDVIVKAINKKK